MSDFIFTDYILGIAVFIFSIALGLILPSMIFANRVVEEKVIDHAKEKLRIGERAKHYQDIFRQL